MGYRDFTLAKAKASLFNLDVAQGLTGYCDFIISAAQEQYFITAPVVTIICHD